MPAFPRRGARTAALATGLAAALGLTACSAGTPNPDGATPDADATLRVGLVLEPDNLDIRRTSGAALEQALIDNVYEGLVGRAPSGEIVPRLAASYEVSPDGLTYSFTLEEGVTFHDGGDLTVDDVVASLEAVRDDESFVDHAVLADVASIEAPDDATVVISLSEPNQNFLFALSGRAGLVFDEGDDTDLRTAANGTGPFTVADWVDGDHLTLARNDAYWGDPAGVAEVVLQYIPDPTALVNAGLDDALDVLTAVDAEFVPELEGAFEVSEGLTTDKFLLAFNDSVPPLDDIRVRQALRMAIDHQAVVDTVGAGTTQFGPIPELDPGYEDLSDVVSYDPERARELLAEAGAEDLELELTIPSVYGTTVSTLLVGAFHEIGVELRVEPVEFSTWLNDVYTNQDYELSYVNHVEPRDFGTWADPDYYYAISDEQVFSEVQGLYADAMVETDPDASAELLAEAARIVAEYHPADWLYTRADLVALAPGVEGFPTDATSTRLPLAGVTFAR